MFNINEEELKTAIVAKAAETIIENSADINSLVNKEVKLRLDNIFAATAEAQIKKAIDDAVVKAFDLEYQRTDNFGQPVGEKTTIKKRLDSIITGYWSAKVDPKSGKESSSSYSNTVTRAEYVMTVACAADFSETMKQAALNITGALKDGLRNQMAAHMDDILNGLFRVKSLQDQGKVEKPY